MAALSPARRATVIDALRARAAENPSRIALVAGARVGSPELRLSYGDLVARMDAAAATLRGAGLSRGDRCGLVAPQGASFVVHALAILAAGACVAPIADDLGVRGLEEVVGHARLLHLVRAEASLDAPAHVERGAASPFPHEAELRALDPCYLRFTSGTTRHRKGVVLSHATVQARLDAVNEGLHIAPGDAVLWLLPMAHHFVASILLYLREGATLLLPASSLAAPSLAFAAREGASVLYASPFHHQLLARDEGPSTLGRLRLAVSTAERLRADVAAAFAKRFGTPLVQALGVIECGLPVMNLASATTKPEALGRALPRYDVWLRGEDGSAVTARGPAHTGELCIRGAGLFDAYLDPWLPAAALLGEDGFRTGDEAYCDEDGDLFLVGRRTNRINFAGLKFFSETVEDVLDAHPAVARSRVSPKEHPHLGEVAVAEVVAADPARPPEADALRVFCRERLPAFQVPREIRIVKSLPETATGKLRRWSGGEGT